MNLKHRLVVISFAVLTLLGCGDAHVIAQDQPLRVSFELYENIPFVQVRVNGSEPLSFLVDSGADACLIDSRRAAALGLSVRGQASTTGFGDGSGTLPSQEAPP